MLVTVYICTWNRARLLESTLATLRSLRIPEGVDWELLVVNNNCTDETDAVIARHAGALPIRRLFEPQPGVSRARNCALDAARGDLILSTDDDVLVDPDWLAAFVAAAGRWPDAAYFGGRIQPLYQKEPPRWVAANLGLLEGLLVIREFGPDERPLGPRECPWGANMAFRRHVLEGRRFDVRLGRTAGLMLSGEEPQMIGELRAEGHVGVWVPGASVKHPVDPSRTTARYVWSHHLGYGRTLVRMGLAPAQGPTFLGAPRGLYPQLVREFLRLCYWRTRGNPAWVEALIETARSAGKILEHRKVSTHARSS